MKCQLDDVLVQNKKQMWFTGNSANRFCENVRYCKLLDGDTRINYLSSYCSYQIKKTGTSSILYCLTYFPIIITIPIHSLFYC